ncbi:hypothetical protein [Candidatus Lokiarchaeum ossiferum]|uniref:hypothetical protein n=1 Tax=Candidatus Lokiarchaeum ossiferum TaxID=2951803 RepID=UPI00352BFF2C
MVNEQLTARLSRILLQNQTGMVKEQDVRNLCSSNEEYSQIIPQLVSDFKNLGLSLIRTKFQGDRYFVVTTPGKDSRITPSMYGTMALLIATANEIGNDLDVAKMKKIFKNVWSDVESLITLEYLSLQETKGGEKIEITPIGKGAFKNIMKDLNLKTVSNL